MREVEKAAYSIFTSVHMGIVFYTLCTYCTRVKLDINTGQHEHLDAAVLPTTVNGWMDG